MPSITGPFSSLILTVVFALMWRIHRERWLGLWAVASALWTVRYLASTALERYFSRREITDFSHGICPDCLRIHYPDFADGARH